MEQQREPRTPKGCLAVMVGLDGKQKQRFVVPLEYLAHPLFQTLLKEAEEEYGFDHKGAISIPRGAGDFLAVQSQIHREIFFASTSTAKAAVSVNISSRVSAAEG